MNIKKDSSMYSTMQNRLDFTVVDKDTIKMYQEGSDILENKIKLLIRVYPDNTMAKPWIYRSTDYSKVWEAKEIKGQHFLMELYGQEILLIILSLF